MRSGGKSVHVRCMPSAKPLHKADAVEPSQTISAPSQANGSPSPLVPRRCHFPASNPGDPAAARRQSLHSCGADVGASCNPQDKREDNNGRQNHFVSPSVVRSFQVAPLPLWTALVRFTWRIEPITQNRTRIRSGTLVARRDKPIPSIAAQTCASFRTNPAASRLKEGACKKNSGLVTAMCQMGTHEIGSDRRAWDRLASNHSQGQFVGDRINDSSAARSGEGNEWRQKLCSAKAIRNPSRSVLLPTL